MQRFAATVSYDGTAFAGSQRQVNVRTVQAELEAACQDLFGVPTPVALAGRTDTGVHARGQVAAFSSETSYLPPTVGRALNPRLPHDVAVREVQVVPGEFNPRRCARRRLYRYTITRLPQRDPLTQRFAWNIPGHLDVDAMQEAAAVLPGRRDFMACSGALEAGRTSTRTVLAAVWRSTACATLFDIEADAYLPQMVRRIVGALVRVGRGRLDVNQFNRLLVQAMPGSLGPVAPARGLCLQRVWYNEGYQA